MALQGEKAFVIYMRAGEGRPSVLHPEDRKGIVQFQVRESV